jgi:hypothetical protein
MEAALKLGRQVPFLTIDVTIISFDATSQSTFNIQDNCDAPTSSHATFLTMVTLSVP